MRGTGQDLVVSSVTDAHQGMSLLTGLGASSTFSAHLAARTAQLCFIC
ncbi:glycine/sarcosine/betaine reductase complex component A [Schaalia cardiffensis F0333]|uniref:Glycine/sarcosine/betaine reductase complex component A n=1 Tax=Schaalia cardiffensis F0333 TaxID=888050 RepID=N6W784_9ACTO|nr:glycine/sarcosine/betaine reductase complex component A [Schaalia cardiffensis F0333]